jgi:hypothetical protein
MISPNWTIGVSMDPTTVVGILHVTPVEETDARVRPGVKRRSVANCHQAAQHSAVKRIHRILLSNHLFAGWVHRAPEI